MAVAAGLTSFVGYSSISFLPSFMVRSFDMEIAELGRWLGLILGISGGAGFFFGGYIADHLGRGSHRRALNFIAATVLISAGLSGMMLMAETSTRALLLFILPAATMNVQSSCPFQFPCRPFEHLLLVP